MRQLILVVLMCLLAGGVWLLSGSWRGAEAAPIGSDHLPVKTEDPVEPAKPGVEPRASGAERTAAEPAPDDGRFAYRIQVVRAPGEQPVPGAELLWLPPDFDWSALSDEDRELQRRDDVVFHRTHGEKTVADREGRAVVRADPAGLSLLAVCGELYGSDWFHAVERGSEAPPDPDQEFTLKLREDRTLVVRAVDGRGQPLSGAHVLLRERRGRPDGETEGHLYRIGPTDEEGLASLSHVQMHTAAGSVQVRADLALEMFGGTGEPVEVDLADPPRGPVDVVAPPFGNLEIVLLGPDGQPWALTTDREVQVSIKRSDEDSSGVVTDTNSIYLGLDGRAVAEPVLCGLELRVRAWSGTQYDEVVRGPRRAGERVLVEMRMPADTPILVGRLVDGKGEPIRRPVSLKCELDGATSSRQIGVDKDGRFRAPLMRRFLGGTPTVTVTLREKPGMPTSSSGEATLPGPLTPGPNDVGNVVLAEAPLLVAGRVEWGDGTPVQTPQVAIERTRDGSDGWWEQAWDLHPELSGDGRFVVRGLHQDRKWRLQISGDVQPVDPIEFEPGTRDLVVRVAKGGSVRATFLVEDGLTSGWSAAGKLEFRLRPARPGRPLDRRDFLEQHRRERREQCWVQPTDEGAACQWYGLAPGEYRLTVTCPGIEQPIADVPGIRVPDGGPADDPRLLDIDLRGCVRRIHVTVTDAQGAPIRDEKAGVVLRGGEGTEVEWYGRKLVEEDGRVPFLVSKPVDLIVTAPGFRTRTVPGVFADTTVVLEPAAEVTFRLVGELPELPEGIRLYLSLAGETEPDRRLSYRVHDGRGSSQGNPVSELLGSRAQSLRLEDGTATYTVAHSGTRMLRLRLYRRVEGRSQAEYVDVQPANLDLDALRDGREIGVRFAPAAVEAAVEALMR